MPFSRMLPDDGFMIFMAHRASVDFPQPDSPTIPSTSPRESASDTPRTA